MKGIAKNLNFGINSHSGRVALGALAILFAICIFSTYSPAHEGGARIAPSKQSVMAGETLIIKGTGFEGVSEVAVTLEGLEGKLDAGTFTIDKEDFEIRVNTPMNLKAGVWKVVVEGAGKKASATITVSAHDMEKMTEMMEENESAEGVSEEAMDAHHEEMMRQMHKGAGTSKPALHASREELNISRPGWLTGIILALSLISLGGGAVLLLKK